jgi:uncharacterized protein (UPF0147 family)
MEGGQERKEEDGMSELDATLREASQLMNGPRMEDRGLPHPIYQAVADAFTALNQRGIALTIQDIYLIHRLTKEAREQVRHNPDNLVDLCGYAAFENHWHETSPTPAHLTGSPSPADDDSAKGIKDHL